MSFSLHKSWDNRADRPKDTIRGRTWTRRIQWLEASDGTIKLKLEEGERYEERLVRYAFAQTIWDRFKTQSIDDSLSILADPVPKYLRSKAESEKHRV